MSRFSLLSLTSILVVSPGLLGSSDPRWSGTFEERVACQGAIERVYASHRIWPQQNAAPRPAPEYAVPRDVLERKVHDALQKAQALAEIWGQPITAAQLQGEIDRMARDTQRPGVLRELWDALGAVPSRIAECLALPLVAERRVRAFYEGSAAPGSEPRWLALAAHPAALEAEPKPSYDAWWEGIRASLRAQGGAVVGALDFWLPELAAGAATCVDDSWRPTRSLPEGIFNATAVWTGAEMIYWGGATMAGGVANTGARYSPDTDTWHNMSTVDAPLRRAQHTAIWTGEEMIVWAGCVGTGHLCGTNTGGRYNPASDTWTLTTTANAPSLRRSHSAVWTGSRMIVWGGCTPSFDGRCPLLASGGVYDPFTDSWTTTTSVGAPSPRAGHTAVWTDLEMIVWGAASDSSGGRYNPASDTWTPTSTVDAPSPRNSHSALWTGSAMLLWGGGIFPSAFNTGGQYNPVSDSWTPITTEGAPSPRSSHTAIWTGSEMILWGGGVGSSRFGDGSRYDPAANVWTPISSVGAPSPRAGHRAVWTGAQMLVFGGASDKTGGRYDLARDSWQPTDSNDAVMARERHAALWTGAEMIVWGGESQLLGTVNTGGRYDPATDSWRAISTSGAPFGRWNFAAVWTGTEMLVWGGQYGSTCFGDGGRYNPATDSWTAIPISAAPAVRAGHAGVWSGSEFIVWGGTCDRQYNDGGRYNPETNTWVAITTAGAPEPRYLHSAVWAGNQLMVWGGAQFGTGFYFNNGGLYDPMTDTWVPTGTDGAPSGRIGNTLAWTGTEVLVWGGATLSSRFGDGARYDPASDLWTPISSSEAPSARAGHTSVWTGAELIIWGGAGSSGSLGTGGRYNPLADSWRATSASSAPSARNNHSAIWTGDEMIIWGGFIPDMSTYTASGGRYCAAR